MLGYTAFLFKTKKEEKADGQIWIKSKRVFVQYAKGSGAKPTIYPHEGIKLLVNNVQYDKPVTICENDSVEILPQSISQEEQVDVTISENQAEAWLHITPAREIRYEILDSAPENKLEIRAFGLIQNIRFIPKQFVYEKLKEKDIKTGIIDTNIELACNTYEQRNLLIATGVPAVLSQDAWIEYFFTEQEFEVHLNEYKKGKVDFKNATDYLCSNTGDILAVKHSPYYGKEGLSVTGEVIPSGVPQDIILKAGNGVVIEGNGRIARCIKPGKAKKIINKNVVTISINETLTINKNIDMRLGNIKFEGNADINGSIKEAMEITAGGNIKISGDSLFAVVKSTSDININGNVISSRVETEEPLEFNKIALKYIDPIIEAIDEIIPKIEYPCKNKSLLDVYPNGICDKFKEIVRVRFPRLHRQIRNLMCILKIEKFDFLTAKSAQMVSALKILSKNCESIKSIDNLYEIRAIISAPIYQITQPGNDNGDICLSYTANSTINSRGKISIGSKGCINSNLKAKDSIIIAGPVRGGKIHSEKSIELNTVGSNTGVITVISVPENGTIKIKKVFNDTIIQIGKFSHRFIETKENVTASIVDDILAIR